MTRALRGLRAPVIALLAIELLDEFVFGAREAAWPAIRDELDLSYVQIGLLLSVPTARRRSSNLCSVCSVTAAGAA